MSMKKENRRKGNNKGFSLVELIIVIAIMAVLVGILAPQFIRYVERSRRATDIKNAQEIATVLSVNLADGIIDDTNNTGVVSAIGGALDGLPSVPEVQGNATDEDQFSYEVDIDTGAVEVTVGSYELYPGADVEAYTND